MRRVAMWESRIPLANQSQQDNPNWWYQHLLESGVSLCCFGLTFSVALSFFKLVITPALSIPPTSVTKDPFPDLMSGKRQTIYIIRSAASSDPVPRCATESTSWTDSGMPAISGANDSDSLISMCCSVCAWLGYSYSVVRTSSSVPRGAFTRSGKTTSVD